MTKMKIEKVLKDWKHLGIAMPRGDKGSFDAEVTGDPCIVWDETIRKWRMFYFAQRRNEEGKEFNSVAHSIQIEFDNEKRWEKQGKLIYTNPEVVGDGAHKPWILMDPYRPNHPVSINGSFFLFVATYLGENKVIHQASATSLVGPWTFKPEPVIERGSNNDFDAYHVDTVTAYWFEDRKKILIYYKGYPATPQADQPGSPYGSATAAALLDPETGECQKIGKIITPSEGSHGTAGWVSTIQLFPAKKGGWFGLITGSPNPPASPEEEPEMREPAPSLGSWAYTEDEWPVSGWKVEKEPITTLDAIPEKAKEWGEKTNLWRHHILLLPDDSAQLYYNAGSYGTERMFFRESITQSKKRA